ncbi:MAG: hypothetical protein K5637_08380 [Lachnospiraceae bacterium]|nr:hypothetical protein [Lachnospiraceae bacterium]
MRKKTSSKYMLVLLTAVVFSLFFSERAIAASVETPQETVTESVIASEEAVAEDSQNYAAGTTGAVLENGVYVYYENGVRAEKTGLAKAVDGTGWYYMANGVHDSSAEGICKRIDGVGSWFYVRDGKYRTDLSGIAKKVDRTGGWYYVKNGVYNTSATGISKKIDGTGGWYYVKNGVYNTNVTGIAKRVDGVGGWYYVKNGVYKTNVTGIAKRADGVGGWYYVKNGVYNTNATGIAKKADGTGGWYFVYKGVYKTDATGIAKKADGTGGWYYVKNGVYKTNVSGICQKAYSTDSRWYYVQNGVYKSTASGIAKLTSGEAGWYYVRNGVYRPGASGIAKKADGSSDTWFYVNGGMYDTGYTGLARKADCSSETQFYVVNGIFTKSNIASYEYQSGTYKITNGVASLQSGYRDLWIQDYGYTYVENDGYVDVYCCLKVKNTDTKHPCDGELQVTSYDSSENVIETSTDYIQSIAAGDSIYCTLHFSYEGEEPAYIGWTITWWFDDTLDVAKSSTFSLTNTSQYKYDYYSKYTGNIKNSNSSDKAVLVTVVYYKDGRIVGGYHQSYTAYANTTTPFSMSVYDEPDYDSYKLFVSQY